MSGAIIISRDENLRAKLSEAPLTWVDSPDAFEAALEAGFDFALVDVCTDCGCPDRDVADIVRACRELGKARTVVAFLSGCGGDSAIRAHLAGADRVIPANLIDGELEQL
jgi:DNA-binding response OmpR family regulator